MLTSAYQMLTNTRCAEAYDGVDDYFDIVKEPMHLELMLDRLDHKHYECFEDFMTDINLIVSNALDYNPATGRLLETVVWGTSVLLEWCLQP
jgi:hypothetical protein